MITWVTSCSTNWFVSKQCFFCSVNWQWNAVKLCWFDVTTLVTVVLMRLNLNCRHDYFQRKIAEKKQQAAEKAQRKTQWVLHLHVYNVTIVTTVVLMAVFHVNLGQPGLPQSSSSSCSGRELLETRGTGFFYWPDVLPVTCPTASIAMKETFLWLHTVITRYISRINHQWVDIFTALLMRCQLWEVKMMQLRV